MIGLPLVRSPGVRVEALGLLGVAAASRDDLALVQEGVGDRDRLIEQAARIVAQVDDEALELVAALRCSDRRSPSCTPSVVCSLNWVTRI